MENIFICPGAQKAGTTTLYEILKQHPQLCLSSKKETKYFLKDIDELSLIDYRDNYFRHCNGKNVIGEIDPEYLFYRDVPRKIKSVLGSNVKFVFLLRNPVDRAYSHYWMSYRRGFEMDTFENAFLLEKDRLKTNEKKDIWHHSYFERGFYSKQIENYLRFFPVENMHFIVFEEFIKKKNEVMKELLRFLCVDDRFQFEDIEKRYNKGTMPKSKVLSHLFGQPMLIKKIGKIFIPFRSIRWKIYSLLEKYNVSDKKPPFMKEETRDKLIDYYRVDIKKLEIIIKKDISCWVK